MKLTSLALPALGAVVVRASKVDPSYTFEQYQVEFSKVYKDATEAEYRRQVFTKALTEALAHNADETQTWKKGINQFSDYTPDEFAHSHGWLPSAGLDIEFQEAPPVPASFKLGDLPASVSWKNMTTPVKNQGACGSCWAFSSTESIESKLAQATGKLIELSPQNLVSCDPNPDHCGGTGGCKGSVPELAFKWTSEHGIASEADYPYVSGTTRATEDCKPEIKPTAKVKSFVKLASNNYTEVMHTLATVGPVSINVDALPMQYYQNGVFKGCTKAKTDIDHVIQLVGYGVDADTNLNYWLVRNSWGAGWGEAGYMRLLRHDPSEDWCASDVTPKDGTGCNGGPDKVTVCGSCGILYDVSYPTGAALV
jgi:cathepsin L